MSLWSTNLFDFFLVQTSKRHTYFCRYVYRKHILTHTVHPGWADNCLRENMSLGRSLLGNKIADCTHSSLVGTICCKRESYQGTEPFRLKGVYCKKSRRVFVRWLGIWGLPPAMVADVCSILCSTDWDGLQDWLPNLLVTFLLFLLQQMLPPDKALTPNAMRDPLTILCILKTQTSDLTLSPLSTSVYLMSMKTQSLLHTGGMPEWMQYGPNWVKVCQKMPQNMDSPSALRTLCSFRDEQKSLWM